MPRSPPAEKVLFRLLDEDDVTIDDQSVPILIPQFSLGGLSDAGGTEEHYAGILVGDEGAMELDDVVLNCMRIKNSEHKIIYIRFALKS